MKKQLHSEIEIDAPPERVWAVLTDFERYPEWNDFVSSVHGELAEGNRLRVRLTPPGGRAITMRPRVTVVDPGVAFEWLGHFGVAGIFDGRHRFELRPTAGGTMFVQRESFSGVLVRLLARMLDTSTAAGFLAMNEALKTRAEKVAAIR
jgi:hypothetical protein